MGRVATFQIRHYILPRAPLDKGQVSLTAFWIPCLNIATVGIFGLSTFPFWCEAEKN